MVIGKNSEIFRSDMFYAVHLNPDNKDDIEDIKKFKIDVSEGQGLSEYLKKYACNDEINGEMRTYLVRDNNTDELAGYFSLKAGLISLNETESETVIPDTGECMTVREFDTLPGVELANFAVNSNYINSYPYQKGIGYVIFKKLIMSVVKTTVQLQFHLLFVP